MNENNLEIGEFSVVFPDYCAITVHLSSFNKWITTNRNDHYSDVVK